LVTYIFIVDDDALTVFDIDSVCSPDPAFPEDAVDPRETDLGARNVIHVDADRLGIPECSLVVLVLGFFDAELLRIAELLSLKLEGSLLLVNPLKRRALQLTLRENEFVGTITVQYAQDDKLAIHDLASVGSSHLGDNGQPNRLHPGQDLLDVAHLEGRPRWVVRRLPIP
jgi:hypothetical protein